MRHLKGIQNSTHEWRILVSSLYQLSIQNRMMWHGVVPNCIFGRASRASTQINQDNFPIDNVFWGAKKQHRDKPYAARQKMVIAPLRNELLSMKVLWNFKTQLEEGGNKLHLSEKGSEVYIKDELQQR